MSCRTWKLDSAIHSWPTVRSRRWLEEFLETAATDSNVLAVVAVGSSVRPGMESDDLDLVVVCEDPEELDYRAPIEVDMRGFDVAEVDRMLSEGHDLLGWAVEFGEPLFDREETWNQLDERWGGRVPLPDPAVARERARKTHERLEEVRSIGDEAAAIEQELSYWTLIARALLSEAGVYPRSRPELPEQLREIGERGTAQRLERALAQRVEEVATSTQGDATGSARSRQVIVCRGVDLRLGGLVVRVTMPRKPRSLVTRRSRSPRGTPHGPA